MTLRLFTIHDRLFPAMLVGRLNVSGDELREIFEEVLPVELIEQLAGELGVVERQRKLDIMAFIFSLILTAGTGEGSLQADALRRYLELDVPRLARSSFYKRFDAALEALLERLSERTLAYCRRQELDLPGYLGCVLDWRVVDSETVRVSDALKHLYSGTGDYAAFKVHKTLSLGSGCPVAYHVSPASEHDSPHLRIDEGWRGYGLLCDLGYASFERIAACNEHGVAYVIRLKDNWKPKVDHVARGTLKKTFFPGTDLDVLLEREVLALDGKAIDCDVTLGTDGLRARLVGIHTPKGYCFFLTNLPGRIGPVQVATLYRLRWEIELSNKLDKTVSRLDHTGAERACSLKTMLHACMISSALIALIVHRHNLNTRPKGNRSRSLAPLHPILLGKAMVAFHVTIRTILLEEPERWDWLAERLGHLGKDPNWRRKPSAFDQLRGFKVRPGKKREKTKSASGKTA